MELERTEEEKGVDRQNESRIGQTCEKKREA